MGDELFGGCWEAQVLVIIDKGSIYKLYKLLGEFRLLVYVEISYSAKIDEIAITYLLQGTGYVSRIHVE